MRYIGNKSNLLDFIYKPIEERDICNGIFCDIFSGTKIPKFSGLSGIIEKPNISKVIQFLNDSKGREGFIFKNFTLEGTKKSMSKYKRNYFSHENGKKIDAIRDKIEEWKNEGKINEIEFYVLLCTLLEKVPSISNIAGTYGAFLKINDQRMFKPLLLNVLNLIESNIKHYCYKESANQLVRKISPDVLYIDPPYNTRQYASNYHILESIAVWDKKIRDNKTGLRNYNEQKSDYCYLNKCASAFEDLIMNAKCKHIIFSYNTEGIIPYNEIIRILSLRGEPIEYRQRYRRYKSNGNGIKNHKGNELEELLFYVRTENNS